MPRAPEFWHHDGLLPRLLAPAGALYGAVSARRMRRPPTVTPDAPVIAVGNLVAGGAGKTPTTLALAHLLHACHETPAIVMRGYGGSTIGPHRVDAADTAALVGDEALLAAAAAPTVVARDRAAGTALAVEAGATVVLFDDGFQNPTVAKRLSVLVVDAGYGIGNGRVIPAGPLRAPLDAQMPFADAVVMIRDAAGADHGAEVRARAAVLGRPVFEASLKPVDAQRFSGWPVVAYAGIGRPEKVADTLKALGAEVRAFVAFPDHHVYREEDATRLIELARQHGAQLVTTAKDWVRLGQPETGALAALKAASDRLDVALVFERVLDVTIFLTRRLRR